MKKTILVLLMLLSSCSTKTENNTTEPVGVDEPEEEVVVDIWAIEPNLEYDNAIINLTFYNYDGLFVNREEPYGDHHKGEVIVEKDGKYGQLTSDGNINVNIEYGDMVVLYDGTILFSLKEGIGPCAVLNTDNSVDYIDSCGIGSDGYYVAFMQTESGYMLLAYDEYDVTEYTKDLYGDKFLLASKSNKYSGLDDYILIENDKTTSFGLNPREIYCFDYSSNIILFSTEHPLDENYHAVNPKYYDEKGNLLFDGFDGGLGFYEGYAPVMKNNKWGYIDMNGNLIVDCIFDVATQIYEGKSWVVLNEKLGKLNIIDLINSGFSFSELIADFN